MAEKFVSRRAEVGVAKESTRGTPVNPTHWIPWSSASLIDVITKARETSGMGRLEGSDSSYIVNKSGEGDIEAEVRDAYLGLIFTSLAGASPSSTGSTNYVHTYTLQQDNMHQSLSFLVQTPSDTGVARMFPNAVVDKWALKIEPGNIVTNTISIKSVDGRDWTRQTASYTSLGEKYLPQHLSLKVATDIAGLAAASKISVKALELTIEKNAETDNVLGTLSPEDVNNKELKVSGSLTLNFEDQTWLDYMLAGSYKAMEIKLTQGSNNYFTFQMPRVDFEGWKSDLALSEIAKQSLDFTANYDAANALAVISTWTLANQVASY